MFDDADHALHCLQDLQLGRLTCHFFLKWLLGMTLFFPMAPHCRLALNVGQQPLGHERIWQV